MASDAASDSDPLLEAAIDGFLDWADEEQLLDRVEPLPHSALQRVGAGSVLGDFELVRELGAGSMGVVFEARQLSVPGRTVAVKVLRNLFASAEPTERFRREVAVIGQLDHPNVVPVLSAGVESGVPYYAMKFVRGVTGSVLVKDLGTGRSDAPAIEHVRQRVVDLAGRAPAGDNGDGLSSWETSYVRWVARLGLHVAEALQHTHDHGVVHRDVKPGNVLITTEGRAVLLDFGLAAAEDEHELTQSGSFLGTTAYASPEQVRGEAVDMRSDVYSLGATLFELVAFQRPFDGRTRSELVRAIEKDDPRPISAAVPRDLRTIVSCALSKSPAKRYRTAAALAQDLREYLAGRPIQARPPGWPSRIWREIRLHPRATAVVGLALFLFLGLSARDHWRAWQCLRAGRIQLADAGELVDRRAVARAHFEAVRSAHVVPTREMRRALADLREIDGELQASWRAAESGLSDAFHHVPGYGPARAELARLFAGELEIALAELADVIDPERVRVLESRIAQNVDDPPALLDPTGWIEIASDPPGARLVLTPDGHEAEPRSAVAPFRFEGLAEGSWFVDVTLPDRPAVRSHVRVRRSSADAADPHPSRRLEIRVPPEHESCPGFLYVPGGWTITADDPVRLEWVDSFWIQKLEVALAGWLWFLNNVNFGPDVRSAEFAASPDFKPRFGDREGDWEIELVDGVWCCRRPPSNPAAREDWPVRGITPTEANTYAVHFGLDDTPIEFGYSALPTRAQILRAARGADARRFPWGDRFDPERVANADARPRDTEPFPFPVGYFESDVSPFGVRDLAGSMREMTRSAGSGMRGESALCGGSYRTAGEEQLSPLCMSSTLNVAITDAGFRLVIEPWPAWARRSFPSPSAFDDDFERPDSNDVGGGWIELESELGTPDTDAFGRELCSIENGRMIVGGGHGNDSEFSTAWRPIASSGNGFSVRAVAAVSCRESPDERACGFELRDNVLSPLSFQVSLGLTCGGEVSFAVTNSRRIKADARFEPGEFVELELSYHGGDLQARVWRVGEERPADPLESVETSFNYCPRFLRVHGANYVGGRIFVESIHYRGSLE